MNKKPINDRLTLYQCTVCQQYMSKARLADGTFPVACEPCTTRTVRGIQIHSGLPILVPGQAIFHTEDEHRFMVMATVMDGIHTGRRRYLVACTTCEVLVHEATTGPNHNMQRHLNEWVICPTCGRHNHRDTPYDHQNHDELAHRAQADYDGTSG